MNTPPRKRLGIATGPRQFNGELLDVRAAAAMAGTTEKAIRAGVERRTLPFRRLGARIIFVRHELLEFYRQLPGCTAQEALANVAERQGDKK